MASRLIHCSARWRVHMDCMWRQAERCWWATARIIGSCGSGREQGWDGGEGASNRLTSCCRLRAPQAATHDPRRVRAPGLQAEVWDVGVLFCFVDRKILPAAGKRGTGRNRVRGGALTAVGCGKGVPIRQDDAAPHGAGGGHVDDVARLLAALGAGDETAADPLLSLVYSDLKRLAVQRMARAAPGHTSPLFPCP